MSARHNHHLNDPSLGFDTWVAQMQRSLASIQASGQPLFLVDIPDLFDTYLGSLPIGATQYHNCDCCRRFVNLYGRLVTLGFRAGDVLPVLWSAPIGEKVPEYYRPTARALWDAVADGKVVTPFMSSDAVWGTPEAGGWSHLSVRNATIYQTEDEQTADQAMAAKRESFKVLRRALSEYTEQHIKTALHLLENKALDRPEKVVPKMKWLRDLKERVSAPGVHVNNAIWYTIGTNHVGLTNIRSGMVAFLLDEVKNSTPTLALVAKFNEKMQGDKYKRPVAPPTAGNVQQAQKLVGALGLEPAFERRYATPDEIVAEIWTQPAAAVTEAAHAKLFSDLLPDSRKEAPLHIPVVKASWDKVLPKLENAVRLQALLPGPDAPIITFTTAVHADAPPILRWDNEEQRNPVDWFVAKGGTPVGKVGLHPGWIDVLKVAKDPAHWHGNQGLTQSEMALFVLAGARLRDGADKGIGMALFPESLRHELNAIRRTVEAYSARNNLKRVDSGETAHALAIAKTSRGTLGLRITDTEGMVTEYHIDRWE